MADDKPQNNVEDAFPTTPNELPEAAVLPLEAKQKINWRYWILAWASILFWMIIFWAMVPAYLQLHGISLWKIGLSGYGFQLDPAGLQKFSEFNYVGLSAKNGEPTAASMWVEIIFWSYLGVAASQVYYLTQLISRDDYEFKTGRYFIRTFGIIIRGVSLGTVIIFLLRIITLTIGPVEVSLRQADIQTIIAISFIVGFYNQDTERALRRFWKQAFQTIGTNSAKGEKADSD